MSFLFRPIWQAQGTGALIKRVIGNQHVKRLDPFLLLDYFKVKLPAGFPDHPHRGFETVTYMKSGKVYHEDFKGHKGVIGPGDIQWMTAGKGIVHCEMPASFQQQSIGFQLWLNLKSVDKMKAPNYQDYRNHQIPIINKNGVKVKIICGEWQGSHGPIEYNTPVYYLDIEIGINGIFQIPIPRNWNSLIFPYEGKVEYSCGTSVFDVQSLNCCLMQKSQKQVLTHRIKNNSDIGAKLILLSGQPINEPIESRRLFVMNTKQELSQTYRDYNNSQNGFEGRDLWASKIHKLAQGKKYEDL